ncbi:MAG: ribonuclease III [Deferribacterales bacterium]
MSNNIENILNYKFSNRELLEDALTHSSYSYENKLDKNYERLEFLGDAVLQLIISEYLLLLYKDFDEGLLSRYRSHIVSEEFISKIASKMYLGEFMKMGKGELTTSGWNRPSILCDIFESLVAAIYLDGGYNEARRFVIEKFKDEIDNFIQNNKLYDYKSELQKITQKLFNTLPVYKIVKESGPEHNKTFTIDLYIADKYYSTGEGKTKKKAEQDAAKKAITLLNES